MRNKKKKSLGKYRSGFESTIAALLRYFNIPFEYETDKVEYTIKAVYTPDFKVGDNIYIEAKGFFKPEDRRKLLAVKEANPELDIRLWFMKDNYLTKAKNLCYSDWAKKHGFPFHVGDSLPKSWFKKSKK